MNPDRPVPKANTGSRFLNWLADTSTAAVPGPNYTLAANLPPDDLEPRIKNPVRCGWVKTR